MIHDLEFAIGGALAMFALLALVGWWRTREVKPEVRMASLVKVKGDLTVRSADGHER